MKRNRDLIYKVYIIIREMSGKASSSAIARKLGVSQRTVQRIIRILRESGYIEATRWGMRIYYRAIKPITIKDIDAILSSSEIREPLVYRYSKIIKDDMNKLNIIGDLVQNIIIRLR